MINNISLINYDNQNLETWIIWCFLTISSLSILGITILVSSIFYKKKRVKIFTMKKIAFMASFLSFFLVQAFIFSPLLKLPIPFSFDSITTITIGFILGPLEGILFGWVADSLRVLINGWGYQLLPSLMYPLIGLISGIFGLIYKYKKVIPKWKSIVIFQIIILSLLVIIIPLEYGFLNINWKDPSVEYDTLKVSAIVIFITTIVTILFMEILFLFFIKNDNADKELFLLLLVICIAYVDRLMELSIRPFTQYFWGYEPYFYALFSRMISSTYLIPTVSITSFILIKTSLYVLDLK